MYLHCYRSGEIVLSRAPDLEGAIQLCEGPKEDLMQQLNAKARLAYDGETWLVPGLPEARSDIEAMTALEAFSARLCQTACA